MTQLKWFAGRRHQLTQNQQDDKHYLIEQLSKFIEEQARMRFQQQIHHHQKQHAAPQEITGPGFSFILPPMTKADFNKDNDEPIQFAVQPFDSRYYESTDGDDATDDLDENLVFENANDPEVPAEGKNKILIPPPMHVMHESGTDKILHRAQQKAKLQQQQAASDVMQKPLQVEFDNTMSLYIVALIAGLSCAFSTGVSSACEKSRVTSIDFIFFIMQLIALGLMYWTLYKKSKSGMSVHVQSSGFT